MVDFMRVKLIGATDNDLLGTYSPLRYDESHVVNDAGRKI